MKNDNFDKYQNSCFNVFSSGDTSNYKMDACSTFWVWSDCNIKMDDSQLSLFSEEDSEQELLEQIADTETNVEIDTIQAACTAIINNFKNRWNNLNIFLYRESKNNCCLQFMKHLPHLMLRHQVVEHIDCIEFDTSFVRELPLFDGWHSIPCNVEKTADVYRKNASHTEIRCMLQDIRQIRMWSWGFEVRTFGDIHIVASLAYATASEALSYTAKNWRHSLSNNIVENARLLEPIFTWNSQKQGMTECQKAK